MIVALNSNWKISIDYFLLNGLCGLEKANLINTDLTIVYNTGVIVETLTFDGAVSNILVATTLGTKRYPSDINSFFSHPVTENVFLTHQSIYKTVGATNI